MSEVKISLSNAINWIQGKIQGSAPANPSAGYRRLFPKSDGWYDVDSSGTVVGPFAAGSSGASADGWTAAGETWTYASADDPTYTFTISGDKTSKYSVGMKLKLTQTTVRYFIITAIAYSDPNTTVTVYGGTDYNLDNAEVTNPYYSAFKSPLNFPMDPTKWTVVTSDTTNRTQSSATEGTVYSPGSLSISIPIGSWILEGSWVHAAQGSSAAQEAINSGLSTATNSFSDAELKAGTVGYVYTNTAAVTAPVFVKKVLNLAAKTSYYPVIQSNQNAGTVNITFQNSTASLLIRAICAYL